MRTDFGSFGEIGLDAADFEDDVIQILRRREIRPVGKPAFDPRIGIGLFAELPRESSLIDERLQNWFEPPPGAEEQTQLPDWADDAHEGVTQTQFELFGAGNGVPSVVLHRRINGMWDVWTCVGEWGAGDDPGHRGERIAAGVAWAKALGHLDERLQIAAGAQPKTLREAIERLKATLTAGATEDQFHNVLDAFPILLNPSVRVPHSKPRFRYPAGSVSSSGKTYVEPDFVLEVGDRRYDVVEIERGAKPISTKTRQQAAGVTQAVHQLREFREFIEDHPSDLQDRFPGIQRAANRRFVLVIGEDAGSNPDDRRSQAKADVLLTWTELIDRGERMLSSYRDDPWRSAGAE